MKRLFVSMAAIAGAAMVLCAACGREARQPAQSKAAGIRSEAAAQANVPHFRDVAEEAGLRYTWIIPGKRPLNIRQTIGNGCALVDFNNDGDLDILLVGPVVALYKGDGNGHFMDVSKETGLAALRGEFLGVAVGDYDGDGRDDLYLSAYRGGALLHNEGGKAFREVSKEAGLAPQAWGTSCVFADFDGDGRLDLYIGNYIAFGPKTEPQMCQFGNTLGSCGPRYYQPVQGVLYRNRGGGRFENVTRAWGASDVSGKCLGVAAADYNQSGRIGLSLANDEMPGDLLQNTGKAKRFENVAIPAGTAHDAAGNVHGGMGVDWGDFDNDGLLDKVVATFSNEAKNVYHNEGDGLFTDRAAALGVVGPMMKFVSFGVKWADFDNDGFQDLLFANGHVQDTISAVDAGLTYRQPIMLLHNEVGAHFTPLSPAEVGEPFSQAIVGRGLAVGDYDNDGKVDALIVDSEGPPLLLHNETRQAGHYLSLRLRKANGASATGAKVTLIFDGKKRYAFCHTDGSYLSASDARVHFGLGGYSGPVTLMVTWPDQKAENFSASKVDITMNLQQKSDGKH